VGVVDDRGVQQDQTAADALGNQVAAPHTAFMRDVIARHLSELTAAREP
jgi:hypothetical protein